MQAAALVQNVAELTHVGFIVSIICIYKLFSFLDRTQKPYNRKNLANWIKRYNGSSMIERWSQWSNDIFISFFGSPHLSLKCFTGSVYITFVASLLFLKPYALFLFVAYQKNPSAAYLVAFMFLGWYAIIILSGYLILWKTRLLLLRSQSRFSRVSTMVILDVSSSFLLSLFALTVGTTIWLEFLPGIMFEIGPVALLSIYLAVSKNILILVLSGKLLVTIGTIMLCLSMQSLWIWATVLVAHIMRYSGRALKLFDKIRPIYDLDIEHHPMHAIGIVICMATILAYLSSYIIDVV